MRLILALGGLVGMAALLSLSVPAEAKIGANKIGANKLAANKRSQAAATSSQSTRSRATI